MGTRSIDDDELDGSPEIGDEVEVAEDRLEVTPCHCCGGHGRELTFKGSLSTVKFGIPSHFDFLYVSVLVLQE